MNKIYTNTPSWFAVLGAVCLLDDGTAAVLLTAAVVAAAGLERGFLAAWESAAARALLCAGGVPPGESGRSLGETRPEVARDCS